MADQNNQQGGTYKGWATPGEDEIVQSTSDAIPSPSVPTEDRIEAPQAYIKSIDARPGEANPALAETIGVQQGTVSTADLLMAREASEEQYLRDANAKIYADQERGTGEAASGGPDDRQSQPMDRVEAPFVESSYMATGAGGGTGIDNQQLKGRTDATEDRAGGIGAGNEGRSHMGGVTNLGTKPDADFYEGREMGRPGPESELDRLSGGMVNLPPETRNGQ